MTRSKEHTKQDVTPTCFARLSVSLLLNLVANGMSIEQILKEYPLLEAGDIREAIHYAAALANDELYPLISSPS
jgi:hypothetical protein